MKLKYERVTTRNWEGRSRTVRLEVVSESAAWLTGYEVDEEGTRIEPRGADNRLHVIDTAAITKRTPLHWNLRYGTLEA